MKYRMPMLLMFLPGMLAMNLSGAQVPDPGEDPPVRDIQFLIEDLGNGYSSPGVTGDLIYVTGEKDSLGYLMAFDWNGKEIWKTCYGPEWTASFPGSRAEPVVDGDRVYVCSGLGALLCYNAKSGTVIWSIDLIRDLEGENVIYGYSMPVLIEGEQLFCSPGGKENNVVSLDKHTGRLLWSSKGAGETSGYGKPRVIKRGELQILLTFSEFTFLGLNANTGEVLWSHELNFKGELPCNEPVYRNGVIYIVAGPGNGAFAFDLSPDGRTIHKRWENLELNSFFGGFVLADNCLVGAAEAKNSYVSVDVSTGKILSWLKFGKGATIAAHDLLVAYNQRGQLGIIRLDQGKLTLLQELPVSGGSGEHFSRPVLFDNMLLIRHGNTLLCYHMEQSGTNT